MKIDFCDIKNPKLVQDYVLAIDPLQSINTSLLNDPQLIGELLETYFFSNKEQLLNTVFAPVDCNKTEKTVKEHLYLDEKDDVNIFSNGLLIVAWTEKNNILFIDQEQRTIYIKNPSSWIEIQDTAT